MRPIGIERVKADISLSGLGAPFFTDVSKGVSTGPGQTTFTVMPPLACSLATVLENAISPPLHAE